MMTTILKGYTVDAISSLRIAVQNRAIVMIMTICDLRHAALLGLNTAIAEYHFRKADEARFDKRRRDELDHLRSVQSHRDATRCHRAQPTEYLSRLQGEEINALWDSLLP